MPLTWTGPAPDPLAWPLPGTAITHPRTAGTFCRALRLLTRGDGGPLGLAEALGKCSLRPARLLEDRVPALRRKGRLQAGSDADLVVLDPATISDQASYVRQHPPVDRVSGTSWSTARSWSATGTSWPAPGPAAPSAPTRAEPGAPVQPGWSHEACSG